MNERARGGKKKPFGLLGGTGGTAPKKNVEKRGTGKGTVFSLHAGGIRKRKKIGFP